MSKLKYTPEAQIVLDSVRGISRYDVNSFAMSLRGRNIPNNFVELVSTTNTFKDALLNHIANNVEPQEFDKIAETLSLGVQGTQGDLAEAYAEVLAALAYAFDKKDLAMDAITRLQPHTASSFIKSTAQALNKDMPAAIYKKMLVDSTQTSNRIWESVEKPTRYPNA